MSVSGSKESQSSASDLSHRFTALIPTENNKDKMPQIKTTKLKWKNTR